MHPCVHAVARPDRPACVMAASGITVSYARLEERSRRCAQMLRGLDIGSGNTVAICMDNNPHYFELCWAAQRAGLHYTCIASTLEAADIAWFVRDSGARALFLSASQRAQAARLATLLGTGVERFAVEGRIDGWRDYESSSARFPAERLSDESSGAELVYVREGGGVPGAIRARLNSRPIEELPSFVQLIGAQYDFCADCVFLCTAPLHAEASLGFCMAMQRYGATVIVMERFDPQWALALIDQYHVTHSLWLTPMLEQMLKLPASTRHLFELASHRVAIHTVAPCPPAVQHEIGEWWGPILHDYHAHLAADS
ncbi:MAG: AMP-binding protein [Pseudomonadales bacterium]|nr:AMP-binding protein [Pseudomonadales bacterium]MCP5320331.1 AMP-binding protein [Pseudomonadales bacterium]MCP5337993.1 AMP-binding protein [Pseudomonadales bacterium]